MNYFVLINIKHDSFVAKFYSDINGFDRMEPVQGFMWPAPLAVYVEDRTVEIGETALEKFDARQLGAHYHLFDLLRNERTFRYYNEERDARQLLYLGIEKVLDCFVREQLRMPEGIEPLRANFPLAFDFDPELSDDEKNYVLTLFRNGHKNRCGGYSNIGSIDSSKIIADEILKNSRQNHLLLLSSNGVDLSFSLFKRDKGLLKNGIIPDAGADPRINALLRVLLEQVKNKNSFVDDNLALRECRPIAENFLSSNNFYQNGCVVISGTSYDYMLTSADAQISTANAGVSLLSQLRAFIGACGIDIADVVVAMRGAEIQNTYFTQLFRDAFDRIVPVDDSLIEKIQQSLIDKVVGQNYILDDGKVDAEKTRQLLFDEFGAIKTSIETVLIPRKDFTEAIASINDFSAECRSKKFNELNAAISELINQIHQAEKAEQLRQRCRAVQRRVRSELVPAKQFSEARTLINDLRTELRNEGYTAFNTELQELISLVDSQTDSIPSFDTPLPPDNGYEPMIERLETEVRALVADGYREEAMSLVANMRADLKGDGITKFNSRLDSLMDIIRGRKSTDSNPTVNSAISTPSDPIREAVQNRNFTLAKQLYEEKEDYDMADLMRTIGRLHHKFEVASRNVDTFRSEGNIVGIKRCIKDLTEYAEQLHNIGLPHSDVDSLLSKFKS